MHTSILFHKLLPNWPEKFFLWDFDKWTQKLLEDTRTLMILVNKAMKYLQLSDVLDKNFAK